MENLQEAKDFDSVRKTLESGKLSEQMTEILAISSEINTTVNDLDLDYFEDGPKMTKAEFIIAGLDLEPIESMYSQEMKLQSVAQLLKVEDGSKTDSKGNKDEKDEWDQELGELD